MSGREIILFAILVVLFVGSNTFSEKRVTSSRIFTKLNSNESRQCQFINHDFTKLLGSWNYIMRSVLSKNSAEIRCGLLMVNEILNDGFKSELKYIKEAGTWFRHEMTGLFIRETIIEIPELRNLITDDPEVQSPYLVQMGICDNDSILIIEPLHYHGGVMVFSRYDLDDVNSIKLRSETFNALRGMEHMQRIFLNCSMGSEVQSACQD